MSRYVITGTDTGVGKTIVSAGLTQYLGATYWKPVQAGLDEETDSEAVARLAPAAGPVLPGAYRLRTPCSPDEAARIDGIRIDDEHLALPPVAGPLVVEGAGGALVPLNEERLFADLFARWGLPVIIVARTGLGTISHSLMTVEALRARSVPVHGIVFSGDANPASEQSIIRHAGVRHLGRLPPITPLDEVGLHNAFATHIALDLLT